MSSSHLFLCLLSGLFPLGFPAKVFYTFLISPMLHPHHHKCLRYEIYTKPKFIPQVLLKKLHHILLKISAEQKDIPTWPAHKRILCHLPQFLRRLRYSQYSDNQVPEDEVCPSPKTVCISNMSQQLAFSISSPIFWPITKTRPVKMIGSI